MSATAIFRVQSFSPTGVDREKGIVYGCQLAKLGKLAVFSDMAGDRQELMVTPSLVAELLQLFLNEERSTAHWGHDWMSADVDPINSTVATWRNFRTSDDGNLIADCFLWPTDKRESVLHAAENDPLGMMVSMVFDYSGGRDNAKALSVSAADLVSQGAATTALCHAILSTHKPKTAKLNMEVSDLIELLKDPAVRAAIVAMAETVESTEPDEVTSEEVAEMEGLTDESKIAMRDRASLTDEEKKDETQPALMARYRRATLAVAKLAKSKTATLSDDDRKIVAKLAAAEVVRGIGTGSVKLNLSATTAQSDAETFITAQLSAGCKNRGEAIARMAKDKPAIYNAAVSAGKL